MVSVTPVNAPPDQALHQKSRSHGRARLRRTKGSDDSGIRAAMHEEIHREMYRSRRYGRSIALLLISPPPDRRDDTRAPDLGTFVRLIDRAWTTEGHMWLLLPETGEDDALRLLDRIRADAPILLVGRSVGLAVFPETALTLEGLLAASRDRSEDMVRLHARRSQMTVVVEQHETVSQATAI